MKKLLPFLLLALLALPAYLVGKAQLHDLQVQKFANWHPSYWAIGLLLVTAADAFLCWQQIERWLRPGLSTAHGSAHWARGDELSAYTTPKGQPGLVLGKSSGTTITLSEKRLMEHVLLIGPTGKGKGVHVIVPGLLREGGNHSLFIIDPKSELVRLTAGAVGKRHRVWVFAPEEEHTATLSYNPLAHLHSFEDALDFATCWVENTGVSSEPFWDNSAKLLLAGAAWHLCETEPDPPCSRLSDLLIGTPFGKLQQELLGSKSEVVRRAVAPVLAHIQQSDKLIGGIMTGMGNRLLLLQSPRIRACTATNQLDFTEMVNVPTALYLSIPASAAARLRPLSACLIMQMFAAWIRLAEQRGGALPQPVLCYLDEFGNCGKIPHMAERITLLRSLRVGLLLAIQDFAQLTRLYGPEEARILRSNAATHIVLRGVGLEEARYYSERIGTTTVASRSRSTGTTTTQRDQETARRLITPEELRTLPAQRMLVLADVAPPALVRATPYYRDKRLASLVNLPTPSLQAVPALGWPPPVGVPPASGGPGAAAPALPAEVDPLGNFPPLKQGSGPLPTFPPPLPPSLPAPGGQNVPPQMVLPSAPPIWPCQPAPSGVKRLWRRLAAWRP